MEGEPSSQKRECSGETDFVLGNEKVTFCLVWQLFGKDKGFLALGAVFFSFFLFKAQISTYETCQNYLYVQVKVL